MCEPCEALVPVVEALKNEPGTTFRKADIRDNLDLAARYRVTEVPTLVFLNGGQIVEKLVGFQSEAELRSKLSILRHRLGS
jgi:thioredoxin 1